MNGRIQVVNLYKHNIVYKNIHNRALKQTLASIGVFVFLFGGIMVSKYSSSLNLGSYYDTVAAVINPIEKLYNDTGNIIFASTNTVSAKDLKIIVPIKCEKLEIKNGTINMTVGDSIMLSAPENGVVEQIGTLLNGRKFIKISLANNFYCVIENVDVVGVKEGEIVKKGKDIATLLKGEVVKMDLFENDHKLTNISVNKNLVEWTI